MVLGKMIETDSPNTLAIQYKWQNRSLIILHNFNKEPQTVTLDSGIIGNRPLTNLITSQRINVSGKKKHQISLKGYGYVWARPVD
jgi:hypothetical protein